MTDRDDALLSLLQRLQALGYAFVTVTPATHARVLARPAPGQPSLRGIFGWNRPFSADELDPELFALMQRAGIVDQVNEGLRSRLRVASLGKDLFLHSAYPTDDQDAVFFGPDTYRFAAFLQRHLPGLAPNSVVDMGAGSGAGGIFAAHLAPSAGLALVDINPAALDLARVNVAAAGVRATLAQCVDDAPQPDLIIANPPYIMDDDRRTYRDGGELLGGQVALDWATRALDALQPGGSMLLYTGAAYSHGASPLLDALEALCLEAGASLAVERLDPDVFGEELEKPAYVEVERIAAVGVVIRKG